MEKVTLTQIAKLSGVTPATVSLVLNNKAGVSTEMRKKIMKLALEMNYISANNSFSTQKGLKLYKFGILFLAELNPSLYGGAGKSYLLDLLSSCVEHAKNKNCNIFVKAASYEDFKAGKLTKEIEDEKLDGLIVRSYLDVEIYALIDKFDLPTVMLDSSELDYKYNHVMVDNIYAMRLLVEHLRDRGAKKLSVITGCMTYLSSHERLAFLQIYAEQYGLELPKENIIIESGYDETSGMRGIQKLLDNGCEFDTVVAQNDLIAIGAFEELINRKISVPNKVKLVGFDNMNILTATKKITSIDCNLRQLGSNAVDLLFDMLISKGDKNNLHIRVCPTLVEGDTT